MRIAKINHAIEALRRLKVATVKAQRTTDARAALPAGSTRARVTTANARWSTAAEARDRAIEHAREAVREAGLS